MSVDYDVSRAFKRIENELIDSMIRNLKRHRVDELKEGMNWEQWQVLQLKELEKYRLNNPKMFAKDFSDINKRVENAFRSTYQGASTAEEAKILDMIRQGKIRRSHSGSVSSEFFGINEARFEHLVSATKADFVRGEWSMLRQANDKYRSIIFDAQTYSATGATYAQAVDMATKDYLRNGIRSITYKNGSRHSVEEYASMAIRTGQKRAYLMGEGDAHDKYGIHTVRVNKRVDACPLCVKWLGKVLVDDVYAGGTFEEAQKAGVPLLSEAIDEGFLHPNCKDVYSMYVEGISKPAKPWTKEEMQEIADRYNAQEELKRAEDMQNSYDRMARNSLDRQNQQRYRSRADAWQNRIDQINAGNAPPPIIPATPTQPTPKQASVVTQAPSKEGQRLIDYCDNAGIQRIPVQQLSTPITSEQALVQKISGGDRTKGSCVSLAMTYIANTLGLDVRDFRGGKSCNAFALNFNNRKLCKLNGVKAFQTSDYSAIKSAKDCIATMQNGKDYMLVTGRHASMVRLGKITATNPTGLEYLELQSQFASGWHAFEDTANNVTIEKRLRNRFGCTKSRTSYGTKFKQDSYIIEADSFKGNPDFEQMLEFINTQAGQEKRGVGGSVK